MMKKFIRNHLMLCITIMIGILLVFIPIIKQTISPELTVDGLYNFIGSFFGIIGAVLLAFSENKRQNETLREEIEMNAKKDRSIQAEFLYRELLFQKIENLYSKLNTCIYKNEESIRRVHYHHTEPHPEILVEKLIKNRNETEKLIHDIELLSIYFQDYTPTISMIVSLFDQSTEHLYHVEMRLNEWNTSEFKQRMTKYSELLEELDRSLDRLAIDLMAKMGNEIQELDRLSKIN
nr:hypothetical protein A5881_000617 [Enterococcus termitis]